MDYADDVTSTTSTPVSSTLRLYDIFIPILGFLIISLNGLVVYSSGLLLKKRQEPRSTYFFLGNVGLSDLLTGFAVLFGQFYPRSIRSDTSCAIQMGMIVSSTLVSVFSVALVAIDRFFYILYGLKYSTYIFPNRARISILITWILGSLIGFLPAMIPTLRGTMSGSQCWFIQMNAEYILTTTIVGIFPVFIIIILYSLILYKALKKVSELKKATSAHESAVSNSNGLRYFTGSTNVLNQSHERETLQENQNESKTFCCCFKRKTPFKDESTQSKRQPSKWKAIKVVLFTTGSFVFTWMPYFIASTMFVYCDHENNENFCNGLKIAIASPLAILGFVNSLLNPIIYAWWHTGFRTNSRRIYANKYRGVSCCQWLTRNSNQDPSTSSGNNNVSVATQSTENTQL